ncbi:MAG: PAS domain S-box protein [bacterium]|nr:PAS domain S-box protein [bacterium]
MKGWGLILLFLLSSPLGLRAEQLRVLAPAHFAPHIYRDDQGQPAGFAAEFLALLSKEMQVTFTYQWKESWPQVIQATEANSWDLIPNLGVSELRSQSFLFSRPYHAFEVSIFVRTASSVDDLKSLEGSFLGVVETNVGQSLLAEDDRFQVQVFPSREQALFELLGGHLDGLVYPRESLLNLAHETGVDQLIRPLQTPIAEVKRALAFPLNRPDLKERFDPVIERLVASPAFFELYAKWHRPPPPFWDSTRLWLAFGGGLFGVSLTLLAWRFLSLEQVNRRLRAALEKQKQAEADLQATQAQFQDIVLSAPFPLMAHSESGQILAVSRAFCELTGYRTEELVDIQAWVSKAFETNQEQIIQHFAALFEQEETTQDSLTTIRTADGQYRQWAISHAPLPPNQARERLIVSMAIDLTENLALQAELTSSQESYRALVEHSVDPIFSFDAQGKILLWNQGAEGLFGYRAEELIGQPIDLLFEPDTSQSPPFKMSHPQLSPGESTAPREYLGKSKQGVYLPVEGALACWEGAGGLYYSGVFRDLRQHKAAEAEVLALNQDLEQRVLKRTRQLEKAQQNLVVQEKLSSLGRMTAGIAHEIRNPLNFVQNFTELLVDLLKASELSPEQIQHGQQMALKVQQHAELIGSIVSSMLTHAREQPGLPQIVEFNDLVEQYLTLALHSLKASEDGLDLKVERHFAANIPPIRLYSQEFGRVLLNLFGNAFDAMREKRSQSEKPYHPQMILRSQCNKDGVTLRVFDNGTGISLERQSKIFEPFYTSKPAGQGTGLGLSISYEIVTGQHGGQISVQSVPGEYTEFQIFLPWLEEADSPLPENK